MDIKDIFAVLRASKAHVIAKPAFESAPLIVIGACTFVGVILATFESVNIKLAHVGADLLKIFDKLVVARHGTAPFIIFIVAILT